MADAKSEKQKVQEITEKLEQGIKELFESEKYKTYLNTMSKFHNYSFSYPGSQCGYSTFSTRRTAYEMCRL